MREIKAELTGAAVITALIMQALAWGNIAVGAAKAVPAAYVSEDMPIPSVAPRAAPAPKPTHKPSAPPEPADHVIYLTFDDGPSWNTERILDILDRYRVKATWFVTHTHPEFTHEIGEIARRGHSVGNHTASHDYWSIYSSEDAFFCDLLEMERIIQRETGERPTLTRFPGGSSNTVSCFNPQIMTRLASRLTNRGYTYFDWNVCGDDAVPGATADSVRQRVISGCMENPQAVVLLHDTKDFTVDALEDILTWGRKNGYTFLPLTENSPTARHEIAN